MRPLVDMPLFGFAEGDKRAAFRAPPLAPEPVYPPHGAGFKGEPGGPSEEAAKSIAPDANQLRLMVIEHLEAREAKFGNAYSGETAEEIAAALNRHIRAIQPRISELRKLGKIKPSETRGKSSLGHSAYKWQLARQGAL